jgi:hypothetical protein
LRLTRSEKTLAKNFGGADVIRTLRTADRVEAVRIQIIEGPTRNRKDRKFVEHGERFDLPKAQVSRVKSLLGDRNTFFGRLKLLHL